MTEAAGAAAAASVVTLSTVHGAWRVAMAEMKLRLRARLPGASAFDDAVLGLRHARARGTPAGALLAPAMASSWLVNNQATSPLFQKWLALPLRKSWDELIALVSTGWPTLAPTDRERASALVTELVQAGGNLGAVSKVLALAASEPVPLMPDAALAFVLRAVPVPKELDAQTAPPVHFAPMMDRIAASAAGAAEELAELQAKLKTPFGPRDLVDRLVWFDSVGYRNFRNEQGGWYWIRSASDEGVVFVPGPPPVAPSPCIDVPGEDEFCERAQAALEAALPPLDDEA